MDFKLTEKTTYEKKTKKAKKWHLWFLIFSDGTPDRVYLSRRQAQAYKNAYPLASLRIAHLPIKPIKLK